MKDEILRRIDKYTNDINQLIETRNMLQTQLHNIEQRINNNSAIIFELKDLLDSDIGSYEQEETEK